MFTEWKNPRNSKKKCFLLTIKREEIQFYDLQREGIFFNQQQSFQLSKNWYRNVVSVFYFVCFSGCHFIKGSQFISTQKLGFFFLKYHLFTIKYFKNLLLVQFSLLFPGIVCTVYHVETDQKKITLTKEYTTNKKIDNVTPIWLRFQQYYLPIG